MCFSYSLDYDVLEGKNHVRVTPVTLPVLSTVPSVQQPLPSAFCCIQMNERQAITNNIRL